MSSRSLASMLEVPQNQNQVDIAVFGGSGFYSFVENLREVEIQTPYGPPSEMPRVGQLGDRTIAFIPRHGSEHQIPAHRVNYRANLWAMAALGAKVCVAPFACGSLRPDFDRGDLVFVDQIIDRTHSRDGTFHDGPETFHLPFADPYDTTLRSELAAVARNRGLRVHDSGTVVVIPGPRFSSRAESQWHRAMGADLVNMTQAPEAALAGELGLRYVGIAMVTDFDAGLEGDPNIGAVTEEEVYAFLHSNADSIRGVLVEGLPTLTL